MRATKEHAEEHRNPAQRCDDACDVPGRRCGEERAAEESGINKEHAEEHRNQAQPERQRVARTSNVSPHTTARTGPSNSALASPMTSSREVHGGMCVSSNSATLAFAAI